jgi:ATP-dependent Lon protease
MASDTEFINILTATAGAAEAGSARASQQPLPEVLPILGLADVVVFPGMVAPLLVEAAASIRLIDDVVAGDRFLGLFLQRNPDSENPSPEELWGVGCAARVLKMLKFPDNTVRVLIEGLRRVETSQFLSRDPYLRARIRIMEDATEESIELAALTRNAHNQFLEIIHLSPALSDQVKVAALNTEEPARLSDLIAANLNLNLEERQRLLENQVVKDRLSRLLPLLGRELEVLTLGSKIQKEVASSMSKSQRDYFLREQLRAIQRELGEPDAATGEVKSWRDQLENSVLPDEVKKAARREVERMENIPPTVAEYSVSRNYLDWLLNLPWHQCTEDKLDLSEAERFLDSQHYGLRKVKDRLLEFLAVLKLRRQIRGPILCLVGPPGVGKTSLGRGVADALGRKFIRISLGGMRDEAEIRGHRRTYVGALPGRVIQGLRRAESCNPVILLDELDKIGSDFRGDPAAALLEVLDPQQNSTFTDNYLELPFDLSRALFITTANWLDPVHPALRDRLEIIELPSYTASEKVQIARRFLLPRQLEEHGLPAKQVRIPNSTLNRLIQDYTREAGVRQLEREIATLSRKAARRLATPQPAHSCVTIGPGDLASYLGQPKFFHEMSEPLNDSGVAVGLAWTPFGGDILFVEATRMPGTGKLLLTGSLGDVMKESAQAALSYLRTQGKRLHLDLPSFDKLDLHIHVPAGATPKDGPSAGLAMVVALASLISQKPVRRNLAMTGEISLRGRVLPVGGIKEKLFAAVRAGIRRVILPELNRKDWIEIPEEVQRRLEVHFVRRIAEVLPLALKS